MARSQSVDMPMPGRMLCTKLGFMSHKAAVRNHETNKGIVALLTERVATIPLTVVALFALLYLLGLVRVLPRDFVNNILRYVGVY